MCYLRHNLLPELCLRHFACAYRCADLAGAGVDATTGAITLPTPLHVQNGQPYCSPDCAVLYEQFYAVANCNLYANF